MMYPDGFATDPPLNLNAPLMPIETLAPLLGLALPLNPPLDSQINFAAQAVSRLIRTYCGRFLTFGPYTEDFGHPSHLHRCREGGRWGFKVNLTEWPVAEITALTLNGNPYTVPATLHHDLGRLWLPWEGQPAYWPMPLRVEYQGGWNPLPADLAGVFLDLVRRQLAAMGVDLAASGSTTSTATAPIKAVTVGALKVEYAVNSQQASAGAIGGNSPLGAAALEAYGSTLQPYMSVRRVAATVC